MPADFHLHLRPGVRLQPDGSDLLVVRIDGWAVRHRAPGAAARTLLETLADQGGCIDALIALAQTAESNADAAPLYYLLTRLEQRGMLSYTLRQDDQPLATLEPMTTTFRLAVLDVAAPGYRLSRFAWLRRDGDGVVVECSLGQTRLCITDQRLSAALVRLAQLQTVDTLVEALPGLTPATITGFLTLLASAQAIFPCNGQGQIPEDVDPALRQWEYHDLLFHARSRMGRHDDPVGGTFRFIDQLPHAPAIKPASGSPRVPLLKPDQTSPGPDFFTVLDARRSLRQYGATGNLALAHGAGANPSPGES